MNEAPQISHMDTDPQLWFAGVLEQLFSDVIRNMTSAPGPQTAEGIHASRVAIRRFRSVIRDLEHFLNVEPFTSLQKQLKKIAARMGAVRDEDVFTEGLTRLSGETDVPAAIQHRLDRSRHRREKAFDKLARSLAKMSPDSLTQLFEVAVHATFDSSETSWPASVNAAGSDLIITRLADLIDSGDAIYEPTDSKGLHKLRIAAKRLRYTSEIYTPVFSEALQRFVDEITEMQSLLGDTHDYDLWIRDLSRQLRKTPAVEAEATKSGELAKPLGKLVRKRAKRYAAALKLWTRWQKEGRFNEVRSLMGPDAH